ncbi:HTH-type transcriptional regulator BetI [Pandoraea communis]|uniref:HTH-type transcriptional regulator BetI n=1 Tax=Pandoraea communis TaxID=2508297 RepID=A0A5E4TFG4_9BURK|nr:TetR family transcriptional regulator [Pandoraea communis]VVD85194.1 HTH-type transcriptional regulator BetI [Pandoraea communis]
MSASTEVRGGASDAAAQAERLRTAAYELACARGFSELSARSLAAATGGSPSAVNYHFGGRDQLLLAVYDEVATRLASARESALAQCLATAPSWADLPDVFTSMLQLRLSNDRGVLALLLELEHEVEAGREPQLRPAAQAEVELEWAFWFALAKRFGVSDSAADVWAALGLGLTGLLLCEPDPGARSAWISAPATRLHRRMTAQPVTLLPMRGPTAMAGVEAIAQRLPQANETARKILDAALATIAKKGADRLVQREIASIVGVSLASVTYFFRTKHDLIFAAFAELCRRMHAHVEEFERLGGGEESLAALADRDTFSGFAAMSALLRAAARDESLAPIARDIRQMRGVGSYVMLSKRGISADWLDAFIWGVMMSGKYRPLQFFDPIDSKAKLLEFSTERIGIVFDGASSAHDCR